MNSSYLENNQLLIIFLDITEIFLTFEDENSSLLCIEKLSLGDFSEVTTVHWYMYSSTLFWRAIINFSLKKLQDKSKVLTSYKII